MSVAEHARKIPERVTHLKDTALGVASNLAYPNRSNWSAAEHELFNNPAHSLASKLISIYIKQIGKGIEYDPESGEIPKEGEVIFVYHHPTWRSSIVAPLVVQEQTGRPTTMIVKKPIADPNFVESDIMRERTGKSGDVINSGATSLKKRVVRHGMAYAVKHAANAIPIDREHPDEDFWESVDHAQNNGLIVATAYTISRQPEDDLSKPAKGGARMMQRNPDSPLILMSMTNVSESSEHPIYVSLSQPVTMREIHPDVESVRALSKAQDHIVNGMFELVSRRIPAEIIKRR